MTKSHMNQTIVSRLVACSLVSVLTLAPFAAGQGGHSGTPGGGGGQFQPPTAPAAPAGQGGGGDKPQVPGGGGGQFQPPGQPQTFPGPNGTTFTFPTGLYDEKADAAAVIREARARAKAENKRVLVMWGENMCGFCVFLNDLLKHDPKVHPLVQSEFEWVKVNIGKFDKNIELAQYYDTPLLEQGFGAPALTIIDPDTDRAVDKRGGNSMTAKPMTMTRVFDENVIHEFLFNNRPPARPAQQSINDASARAKKDGLKVLAVFTMPLCDTCDAVRNWMSRGDVSAVLGKAFVVARVDTERMIAGRDLLNKVASSKAVLPPYAAVLDAEGNSAGGGALMTTLPRTDAEIAKFIEGMKAAAPKMSAGDLEILAKSLREAAEAKPAAAEGEKK